ncbi:hypothetical protein MPL1032_180085 [Mesorhizobium plurifarium]|uniref:Uncharacterized protein n=1 Tax=Mesorhizobium plurifarium TaxID=69974 RepID=A0A0K2VU80_MESPL|nr:hypothetical protein MPL1032_180085 [Mesorhizobium plurifarium]
MGAGSSPFSERAASGLCFEKIHEHVSDEMGHQVPSFCILGWALRTASARPNGSTAARAITAANLLPAIT